MEMKMEANNFLIITMKFPWKTFIGWAWVTCLFLVQKIAYS